jgi:thiamine biosynthesis lipoprotein
MPLSPAPARWIQRAQVWLGTLVEVALPASDATEERFAAAFAAIAHVHRTMSAHDSASDLARIARDAHHDAVVVDPETYSVLGLARMLHEITDGAFDVAVAPVLARAGLLPAHATTDLDPVSSMSNVELLPGHRVRTAAPTSLELGGIAKGHAVDRAVAALRAAGVRAGVVNAGGDWRVFGSNEWQALRVRHPMHPTRILALAHVCDASVATSADYFGDERGRLVEPHTRELRPFGASITVVAHCCALADALTKVVALAPEASYSVLSRFGAHAFRLDARDSELLATTTCTSTTAHLRLAPPLAA